MEFLAEELTIAAVQSLFDAVEQGATHRRALKIVANEFAR